MSDYEDPSGSGAHLSRRVDRGDFDAALRPENAEDALRDGPERFFALAAEIGRSQFDPAEQWEEFVRAVWEQVDAGFGLSAADEDDDAIAKTWFDHPEDPPVVAWDRQPDDG